MASCMLYIKPRTPYLMNIHAIQLPAPYFLFHNPIEEIFFSPLGSGKCINIALRVGLHCSVRWMLRARTSQGGGCVIVMQRKNSNRDFDWQEVISSMNAGWQNRGREVCAAAGVVTADSNQGQWKRLLSRPWNAALRWGKDIVDCTQTRFWHAFETPAQWCGHLENAPTGPQCFYA